MRFLAGVSVYALPTGIGKNRLKLFQNALDRHGAREIDENTTDLTGTSQLIVLFDENTFQTFASVEKAIEKKRFYSNAKNQTDCRICFVKSLWLSECLKQKKFVELDHYQLCDDTKNSEEKPTNESVSSSEQHAVQEVSKRKASDDEEHSKKKQSKIESDPNSSSFSESDDENETKINGFENDYLVRQLKSKSNALLHSKQWTCAHSSKENDTRNPNEHVIKKLEEMSTIYESTRDKYRALSYQKAIMAIKRLSRPIQNREVSML